MYASTNEPEDARGNANDEQSGECSTEADDIYG